MYACFPSAEPVNNVLEKEANRTCETVSYNGQGSMYVLNMYVLNIIYRVPFS